MRIDPWYGHDDLAALTPDLVVYTLRLERAFDDPVDDDLCDVAWTTAAECEEHHWRRMDSFRARVVAMPLRDYLRAHLREVRGMNGFFEVGRSEFIEVWQAAHGPLGGE